MRGNRAGATALAVALVTTLAVAGCTSGDDAPTADGDVVRTPPQDLGQPPEVALPTQAPTGLEVSDLVEGDGDVATLGSTLSVHLVGYTVEGGTQVVSSWPYGVPRTLQLREGALIEGLRIGLQGMRVGGRRYVAVPPDLGYGEAGAPPDIGPGTALVFVVDLLAVTAPSG